MSASACLALLRRDLLLAYRRRLEVLQPLLFLLLVVSLFPLGVGPGPQRLAEIAAGVIWIAALLSSVLSLETLFRPDYDDGSLEQWLLSGQPLTLLALTKCLAHWLVSGLPLLLIAPLLATWMNLPDQALPVLLLTLALGTPVLSLMGAISSALTVGARRGGQLLSLLVFPLLVPLLIVATSAIMAAVDGLPYHGQLGLLAAGLVAALTLAPLAIAAALRLAVE